MRNATAGAEGLLLLALALSLWAITDAAWRQDAALVLDHVTVVDTAKLTVRRSCQVLIREGRIEAVRQAGTQPPAGARVVEARGKYLIPGLWDLHVHLGVAGPEALGLLIAHGVTGVRDLGGDFEQVRAMRRQVESGTLVGPRIRTAGAILETERFVGVLRMVAERLEEPYASALRRMAEDRIAVTTGEQARAAVRRLAAEGADTIKFRSVASLELLRVLAEEAERHGLLLAGHVPQGFSVAEAAEAGQRSFEHSLLAPGKLTLENEEEAIERLARAGAVVVPTIVTLRATRLLPAAEQQALLEDLEGRLDPRRCYAGEPLLEHWRLQIRLDAFESPADWQAHHQASVGLLQRLHKAGVPVLPGTDLGSRFIYPGWSLHDELEALVGEIGMSAGEALRAATLFAARLAGLEEQAGTIEPGKAADMVLLDANPLEQIGHTRRIHAVILGGRYLDGRALAGLRQGAMRPPAYRGIGKRAPLAYDGKLCASLATRPWPHGPAAQTGRAEELQ